MIAALIALLLTTDAEVEQLRRTAPAYLTLESARLNFAAARAASWSHGPRRSLLNALAWHESRFKPDEVTREPGGRVSCGIMTPYPKARCSAEDLQMLGGYLEGARHLAMWLSRYQGNEVAALWAMAGGSAQVRACRAGSNARACRFAFEMIALSRAIERRPTT